MVNSNSKSSSASYAIDVPCDAVRCRAMCQGLHVLPSRKTSTAREKRVRDPRCRASENLPECRHDRASHDPHM